MADPPSNQKLKEKRRLEGRELEDSRGSGELASVKQLARRWSAGCLADRVRQRGGDAMARASVHRHSPLFAPQPSDGPHRRTLNNTE